MHVGLESRCRSLLNCRLEFAVNVAAHAEGAWISASCCQSLYGIPLYSMICLAASVQLKLNSITRHKLCCAMEDTLLSGRNRSSASRCGNRHEAVSPQR